jgi:hypothetical protein
VLLEKRQSLMMKKIAITSGTILVLFLHCGTGVAEVRDSYINKNTPSASFQEDFCKAVVAQKLRCWTNDQGGLVFAGQFGDALLYEINGALDYSTGDPAYRIKPIFKSNNMVGEKSAQERFWGKVIESLTTSYNYGLIEQETYTAAEQEFLIRQAEENRQAEILKQKEAARRAKLLVPLTTNRSCQNLKTSFIKCAKGAMGERWKSDTAVWADLQRGEMTMPGGACTIICSSELTEKCVRVGFAKFPKDFLDEDICKSICEKCWFP